MTVDETRALVAKIEAAEAGEDPRVEPMVKQLIYGVAVNIARIADAANRKKDKARG